MTGTRRRLLLLALVVFCGAAVTGSVSAAPLVVGHVLAGTGNGTIKEFTPTGTLVQTLLTGAGNPFDTGMCFRANGNLLATNFGGGTAGMTEFSAATGAAVGPFGSGFNTDPESCAVDSAGNVYVGQADGSQDILKFSSAGALLASYNVAVGPRGSDWIDLAADQQTLFYTSEGGSIRRFNAATNTQLADFATGLAGPCFSLRIRPNGEVMVACSQIVYRLSAAGAVIQTYPFGAAGELFALNLDPDNTTFWTGDDQNGVVYHVDIATGAVLGSFPSNPSTGLFGLAVVGEIRVAQQPPTCMLTATITGPPKQIQITTQAAGGLAAIIVLDSSNANTVVPPFTPGTTNPVVVTSTKINQSAGAHVALQVTAVSGGTTTCDPVLPGTKAHAQPLKLVFQHVLGVLGQLGRLVRL